MAALRRRAYLGVVLTVMAMAAALFIGAGSVRWGWAWGFTGAVAVVALRLVHWMGAHNPALLQERLTGMGHSAQPAWDRRWVLLVYSLGALWLVSLGVTAVRWPMMPPVTSGARVLGVVLVALGAWLLEATVRSNAFLSPAVRVQHERGHVVVQHGPYRWIRHPMYAALLPLGVGTALWLGTWPGVAGALLLWALVLWRAYGEEQLLSDELPGYREYAAVVRARVVPFVW